MKTVNIRQRTPGHYSSLLGNADSQAMMLSLITPGSRGYLKRYVWNTLQPVAGGPCNFAEVISDLAFCAAHGLKLVAMIVDKSFSGPTRNLPKGMETLEALNTVGGYTALRFKPAYVTALNALVAQFTQFDTNEAFEGVAFVETSTSMDHKVEVGLGYTPELYRDAYIAFLTNAAKVLPHSQVFWFMNFLPGNQAYIASIADAVRGAGVSMGGPDCLPDSTNLVAQAYPYYAEFKGRMNLFTQMSLPGFSQTKPDGTLYSMTDMLTFMRESLFADYCFWMPIAEPAAGKGYGWKDAIPVIAANPVINF